MANLKPGWQRVKFAQLAECVNDRVDDPSKAGVDRYVGLEHLDPESLSIRRWGTPDEVESTKLRFRPGDIIFGKRRAYQRKLAVADFDGICSAHAMVLRAKSDVVLPEFLPFLMQSDTFMERAVAISVGSLSPTINWKTLAAEEFALPPMEEQRRIADMLKAVECACLATDEARRTGATTIAAFAEERVRTLTANYAKKPIFDVTLLVTKGESPRWQGFEYCDQGVRFVTSENVLDGHLALSPAKFLPFDFGAKLARSRLQPSDILINIVGGSIGRLCCVPDGLGEANINQAVALVRPNPEVVASGYLFSFLSSPSVKHALCSKKVDDYKPNLSLTAIRDFHVPVPPLSVQEAFVRQTEMLRSGVDSLAARWCALRDYRSRLTSHVIGEPRS